VDERQPQSGAAGSTVDDLWGSDVLLRLYEDGPAAAWQAGSGASEGNIVVVFFTVNRSSFPINRFSCITMQQQFHVLTRKGN